MFQLSYNGTIVANVRCGEKGTLVADFPDSLTLTPYDMVNVQDVRIIDHGRTGRLTIRLTDNLELALEYSLPPETKCARCGTLHYQDNVRYCGVAECQDNPELLPYKYSCMCLSCVGILVDEQVTPVTG